MTITIYGIKTCDTCRKALKTLPDAVLRDIRTEPLTEAERTEFISAFGDEIINRSSTTWRAMDDSARNAPVDTLLAAHPTVMKRPIIRAGDALFLGWKADVQRALGGA